MKAPSNGDVQQGAYTRVGLLTIVAAQAFLAAVVLPALASTRPRSARVICANNLRQIGTGMHQVSNQALRDAALAQLPGDGPASFHFVTPR